MGERNFSFAKDAYVTDGGELSSARDTCGARDAEDGSKLFEELLRQHERQLYRAAYRMTGNHDDAEDLIQETVVEALKSFHCFQPGTRFDRWFLRIMTNNHIDRARRNGRMKVFSIDSPMDAHNREEQKLEVPDHSGDPQSVVLDRIMDATIQESLNRLPEEFRAAVILSDIEDLSYEEISQIMKCPVGTVRSRLHRGRNMLKRLLQDGMRKEASQQ